MAQGPLEKLASLAEAGAKTSEETPAEGGEPKGSAPTPGVNPTVVRSGWSFALGAPTIAAGVPFSKTGPLESGVAWTIPECPGLQVGLAGPWRQFFPHLCDPWSAEPQIVHTCLNTQLSNLHLPFWNR